MYVMLGGVFIHVSHSSALHRTHRYIYPQLSDARLALPRHVCRKGLLLFFFSLSPRRSCRSLCPCRLFHRLRTLFCRPLRLQLFGPRLSRAPGGLFLDQPLLLVGQLPELLRTLDYAGLLLGGAQPVRAA